MIKRLECQIFGRVQGTLLRDSTRRRARGLGLVGFVVNNSDGTVTAMAEGEENDLKQLLIYLHKGTPLARVDRIDENWTEPIGEFKNFEIRYRNFLDRL